MSIEFSIYILLDIKLLISDTLFSLFVTEEAKPNNESRCFSDAYHNFYNT